MTILCSNANLVPKLKLLLAPPLLVGDAPLFHVVGVLPHATTSWWAPTVISVPPSLVSLASRGRKRSGRGALRPLPPGFSNLRASLFHWIFNSSFARHSCEVILTVSMTEISAHLSLKENAKNVIVLWK